MKCFAAVLVVFLLVLGISGCKKKQTETSGSEFQSIAPRTAPAAATGCPGVNANVGKNRARRRNAQFIRGKVIHLDSRRRSYQGNRDCNSACSRRIRRELRSGLPAKSRRHDVSTTSHARMAFVG